MNIYFIRHGKAEPTSATKKDKDRELTAEGINIINVSAASWKERITHFDLIITSPFKRAIQTSELIARLFDYKNEIIKDNSIGPGSNTSAIINLAAVLNKDNIAFVGHQPDMSAHISRLVCNTELNIKFPPVTIAKISFDGKLKSGKGTLIFLIPPV